MTGVKEVLSQGDWRRLARTVQSGKCVLVLGPGVAVQPGNKSRIPLSTLLARSLAESLASVDAPAPDTLAHVAQLYLQSDQDRYDLELDVTDFYEQYKDQTTSLHRELAELPFTLCVTTNPDAFLANAFRQAGKEPLVEFYNFRKQRNTRLPEPSHERPVLYGLYGSTEEPESLVLTESDLLDFLVAVISKTPPLPSLLTAMFGDPDMSFLFLGFGFHRWYVRILLHVLQAHGHRTRSLALENPGFFTDPRHPEVALFYGREHFIKFKELSWEDFVSELRQKHQDLVIRELPKAPRPAADAPLLFLCHSRRNQEAVANLAEQLQSLGVRIWLDRQDVRGGDDWDRLVKTVLQKVDYVVVVQSRELDEVKEGYVFKEIRIALERQQKFAPGVRFTIPVTLEPCDGLDLLRHLDFRDISSAEGVQALAEDVLADWEGRHAVAQKAG